MDKVQIIYRPGQGQEELKAELINPYNTLTNYIIGYSHDDGLNIIRFENITKLEDQGEEDDFGDNWKSEDGGLLVWYLNDKNEEEWIEFDGYQFVGDYVQWLVGNGISMEVIKIEPEIKG